LSHTKTVQKEFTRQAGTFRESPTSSAAEVASRVGSSLGPGVERVLDVACGPGLLIPTLAERAASVVGVDLTHENLLLARQSHSQGSINLVRALAEQLPFAADTCDAIERLRDPSHTTLLSRDGLTTHLEEAGFDLREDVRWSQPRELSDWAAIVNEPRRMAALRSGVGGNARRNPESGSMT
jgi:SAM-dependent methyltransferase